MEYWKSIGIRYKNKYEEWKSLRSSKLKESFAIVKILKKVSKAKLESIKFNAPIS